MSLNLTEPPSGRPNPSIKVERILALVALILIGGAWYLGQEKTQADLRPGLEKSLIAAERFESIDAQTVVGWEDAKEALIGYATVGKGEGYGGAITLAVSVTSTGKIIDVHLVDHKETDYFLDRVLESGVLDRLHGKAHTDPFAIGEDVDAVSGATMTLRGLTQATRKASRRLASEQLGLPLIREPAAPLNLGLAEGVLVLLFALGLVGQLNHFPHKKTVRWIALIAALLIIGFVYDRPITMAMINKLLLGYWPDWRTQLYFYLALAGCFAFLIIRGRNIYCYQVCPFGAMQECLAAVGGAKANRWKKARPYLRWAQRAAALTAILIALLYDNPTLSSYEVFSAAFHLIGSNTIFVLLALSLITAFFIKRPWCRYLCPLRPVFDYTLLFRTWAKEAHGPRRTHFTAESIESAE